MLVISKENKKLFERGVLCPKCGCKTNTYRHPFSKLWCSFCQYTLREEGDISEYKYKEHLDREVRFLEEENTTFY